MPEGNRFRHQEYGGVPPSGLYEFVQAGPVVDPMSPDFDRSLAGTGARFRAAGVRGIHLVHGTFVGDDPLGWLRALLSTMPGVAARARGSLKRIADRIVRENGNYTAEFAARLARGTGIPVHRFVWTSENNHLGRADAAVRFLDSVASAGLTPADRLLVFGHSHGGNVLALVSNLIGADAESRKRFFDACRAHAPACSTRSAHEAWRRVRQWIEAPGAREALPRLDLVSFGTPIRYGWDLGGCSGLLHFVHHHPRSGLDPARAACPRSLTAILQAVDGDYVQHLGIAGTNFGPAVVAYRSWITDRRLGGFLAAGLRRRDVFRRLATGPRVAHAGKTLLLDYGRDVDGFPANVLGHALYTRTRWLPFHARAIADRLYPDGKCPT